MKVFLLRGTKMLILAYKNAARSNCISKTEINDERVREATFNNKN